MEEDANEHHDAAGLLAASAPDHADDDLDEAEGKHDNAQQPCQNPGVGHVLRDDQGGLTGGEENPDAECQAHHPVVELGEGKDNADESLGGHWAAHHREEPRHHPRRVCLSPLSAHVLVVGAEDADGDSREESGDAQGTGEDEELERHRPLGRPVRVPLAALLLPDRHGLRQRLVLPVGVLLAVVLAGSFRSCVGHEAFEVVLVHELDGKRAAVSQQLDAARGHAHAPEGPGHVLDDVPQLVTCVVHHAPPVALIVWLLPPLKNLQGEEDGAHDGQQDRERGGRHRARPTSEALSWQGHHKGRAVVEVVGADGFVRRHVDPCARRVRREGEVVRGEESICPGGVRRHQVEQGLRRAICGIGPLMRDVGIAWRRDGLIPSRRHAHVGDLLHPCGLYSRVDEVQPSREPGDRVDGNKVLVPEAATVEAAVRGKRVRERVLRDAGGSERPELVHPETVGDRRVVRAGGQHRGHAATERVAHDVDSVAAVAALQERQEIVVELAGGKEVIDLPHVAGVHVLVATGIYGQTIKVVHHVGGAVRARDGQGALLPALKPVERKVVLLLGELGVQLDVGLELPASNRGAELVDPIGEPRHLLLY
mmetsp:Transcript_58022/g.130783  ORF Transcript_58022/g.130783 Transcript_58022/m.130783 type:complete len:596 (-) Transcript_58022:190-1977(-)